MVARWVAALVVAMDWHLAELTALRLVVQLVSFPRHSSGLCFVDTTLQFTGSAHVVIDLGGSLA